MSNPPYPKIFVVINPAAGKDEPILNILNDVFRQHGVEWEADITHKFGDATELARKAAAAGYDLVAGYGGDGTQHEIANGLIGTGVMMGVLPGGTGNGFANEIGIPKTLRDAVELLCTSHEVRHVDAVQMGDQYFIQRLYVGIEPEEQTSREMKDRYGVLAYGVSAYQQTVNQPESQYRITVDGEVIEMPGTKCYVVNSGRTGTGLSVLGHNFAVDDGLLDVFVLNMRNMETLTAAVNRFLNLNTEQSKRYFWRGRSVTIETTPDQPVWTDGEYVGRTPISVQVLPGVLAIAAPKPQVFVKTTYDAVLMVYDGRSTAANVYQSLQTLEKEKAVKLHLAALVHRRANGKLKIEHKRGASASKGMVGGGAIGLLLLAASGGTLAGVTAVAAGIGALIGSSRSGLQGELKPLLDEKLGQDDSALAFIIDAVDWARLREVLSPFGGAALVTELSPETEAELLAIDQNKEIASAMQAAEQ
ncbi:MAG: YegS/Rv2252/BmrU family lipid kinase [Chloroflexi bacterium]|nr:YegS/Rv2252/BmrU family lipid kinase [Chloroflexota bacterium]MBP7045478.1 YegS/Rv2252/BmrU family lipid kinase [Chloroflexota bacterium]